MTNDLELRWRSTTNQKFISQKPEGMLARDIPLTVIQCRLNAERG